MDEDIKMQISKMLEEEANKIKVSNIDNAKKVKDLSAILRLLQIIDNFDELEPIVQEYINKKAVENKFKNEER